MMGKSVEYEVKGTAAWITLNRPDQRNALSAEVIDGVSRALDTARRAAAVRSVVFAANGPMFCAGADLKNVLGDLDGSDGAALRRFLRSASTLFDKIAAHPQPVVAAVHGAAIAGGLELVLACDVVVAARSATFADGHARYGMFPAGGASIRLPRRIGVNNAKRLMFTAESWSAERMRSVGLVSEVVDDDELPATVTSLTQRIGRFSPLGLSEMKQVVEAGADLSVSRGITHELNTCLNYATSKDFAEGLHAFSARREPEFVGE
ncbi:enoyl-CoA hydratase/isomerase family protein [Spiractinospora alimapuensis]|uniref:enoyl-CoA hydratase/isomerase family protein n=1 Tax=Spiractinospora alimapuensis TaxID=2820884 RepID=UPI001F23BE13|nr:enoyl-CoA hydratase/isomerase family protein [Spiractinospora alimapuensis]QVQ51522.1 enoyl-CoA hydratase/isomerase family protein [Spiractinospora alimapuensis]